MRSLGLAVLLSLVQASTSQQAPATLAAAQAKLGAGDAAGARTILEVVVKERPEDDRAWATLGTTCQRLKDADCAIAAFTRTLELKADDVRAMLGLGVAYAGKPDLDEAFKWLGRARASRRIDMTQLEANAALEDLRADPRYAALQPTPEDFANPFVEPTAIIGEWVGEAAGDQFGWIARSVGDVDGDGAQDFVTSAIGHAAGGKGAGRVYVYSSRKAAPLWTADGAAGDGLGTGLEALGDVNQDGISDVVASAPGGGYTRVFSGRDGKVLLTVKAPEADRGFGGHTQGVGDVNNDKVPDFIVGASGTPKSPKDYEGRAYVFSGKDGAILLTLRGERAGDQFGAAATGSSEDGKILIAVGAPGAGEAHTGATYLFNTMSATPAFVLKGDDTTRALGAMFVAVPGDMNGDGVKEVFTSDFSNAAKGASTGRVYLHSAKTGEVVRTFTGETAGEGFGTSHSTAGDVDGDGTPDLIVGAWQYAGAAIGGGRAYLYSGATGKLIRTFTCRTPGDTLGFDAVGIGDVDKDGTVDLLLTSAWSGVKGFRSGRVFIVSSGVGR